MREAAAEAGLAPCFIHGGLFKFNPYKVAAVLVDPVTGKPPDVDPDPGTPDLDTRVARSVQRFICVPCCERVNQAAGYEHIRILDDGAQVIELRVFIPRAFGVWHIAAYQRAQATTVRGEEHDSRN